MRSKGEYCVLLLWCVAAEGAAWKVNERKKEEEEKEEEKARKFDYEKCREFLWLFKLL